MALIRKFAKIVVIVAIVVLTPPFLITGLWIWSDSDFRMKSVLRNLINNVADVDELLCFGHQSGLLEVSNIAIFKLTPQFSMQLDRNETRFLNNHQLPSSHAEWLQSKWVLAGEDFDQVTRDGKKACRAVHFMTEGNVKNNCGKVISKLKNERSFVSFTYPKNWEISDCNDSCRAYLIFPISKLAVTATID